MEKVYLALETVGLTAEKTKLENDCKEGASELRTTDVGVSHTFTYICPAVESRILSPVLFCVTSVCLLSMCPCSKNAPVWNRGRCSCMNNARAFWRERRRSAGCNLMSHCLKTCAMLVFIMSLNETRLFPLLSLCMGYCPCHVVQSLLWSKILIVVYEIFTVLILC